MDRETLQLQVRSLFAAQQYDAIISLLFDNKDIANRDSFLAIFFLLCFIYSQEKEAGLDTIFSKVSTPEELMERYTRLKFLLTRLDFGISADNEKEMGQFIAEQQVTPYELQVMMERNVIHQSQVWEKLKRI